MSMSLGSIAAVLPLVGGIGIMNIMLVSVTENARKKIFFVQGSGNNVVSSFEDAMKRFSCFSPLG